LTLGLPQEKRHKIAQLVHKFLRLPRCTIREFAQLIGVLVSACPAVKYGWLYTKTLEKQKYLELLNSDNNYEAKMKPSKVILEDLNWWINNVYTSNNCMRYPCFQLEIYSDASNSGWGAVCGENKVNGMWKSSERENHINYLELLAVFLGLKSFARNKTNCAILLRVDNTTAISYVNRMGSIQFPHLNNLARSIWQWCEERNLWIFASYINTKENIADAESRKVINSDTEWELSASAFQSIVKRFGEPVVDLFASRSNAKCSNFVSWKPDPDAIAVDAFTISWRTKYFYAFPPFSLILKCLRKIIDDQAQGILVFPYWPSQPWYPLLQSLLKSEIMFLNPNKTLLYSHFRDFHPLHKELTLGVARLCSSPSVEEAHHQKQ
jgi:ribonuclease HI